jgi:hypothetical protein
MFHVQVPVDDVEWVEFFPTVDGAEDYAEGLLLYSLPDADGFIIYNGDRYASAVVRMPTSGDVMAFRESNYT